ncbi:hypothetical protein TCON_1302 [Astathelohania contejeani]|uniref:Uncharacterized protein n=1 Tax=Astathelohania contejeani TaxID=164912 RepID=A0ABQ7HZ54_9MICR|nr:hypothetical protein TCON_1302 [Thelohania contejeani]
MENSITSINILLQEISLKIQKIYNRLTENVNIDILNEIKIGIDGLLNKNITLNEKYEEMNKYYTMKLEEFKTCSQCKTIEEKCQIGLIEINKLKNELEKLKSSMKSHDVL